LGGSSAPTCASLNAESKPRERFVAQNKPSDPSVARSLVAVRAELDSAQMCLVVEAYSLLMNLPVLSRPEERDCDSGLTP
jgi:hypothetical protein